jgi:iron complex transport system ATP-binding protein
VTTEPIPTRSPALALAGVGLDRDSTTILHDVDWTVGTAERWVVLGPNGSGKSSIVRIASLYLHPSRGTVDVFGHRLGRVDVRRLRNRIGYASAALGDAFRPDLAAADVVMTALNGALEPWWHTYSDADRRRARELLDSVGCGHVAERALITCSSGERQRVLVARTLMTDPGLVLLDEPTAALDLGGREELVATLDELAADPSTPPTVLVTHHLEEIPPSFTHALLVRQGNVVAAGPIDEVIVADTLEACFDMPIEVHRRDGRLWGRAHPKRR